MSYLYINPTVVEGRVFLYWGCEATERSVGWICDWWAGRLYELWPDGLIPVTVDSVKKIEMRTGMSPYVQMGMLVSVFRSEYVDTDTYFRAMRIVENERQGFLDTMDVLVDLCLLLDEWAEGGTDG